MLKKKKILSIALAVIMVASAIVLPQLMFAYDTQGKCGENAVWSFDAASKTLTVSGEGDMDVYERDNIPWRVNFAGEIEKVIVEDEITSVCDGAFAEMENLQSVSFGEGITALPTEICLNDALLEEILIKGEIVSIGDLAFSGCSSISSFDIASTVTDIGRSILTGTAVKQLTINANLNTAGNSFGGAFDIAGLTEVTLGEGVTVIPAYAFYNAISLEKINFTSGIEAIGDCAFAYCTMLQNFDLSESIKKIGRNAFLNSGVTSIVINSDLEDAGDGFGSAFANSNITKVVFGERVTAVPSNVLTYASNVEQVYFLNKDCVIPDSEKTIDESTTIYGCFVSTAKDYAIKYNRNFSLICTTGEHNITQEAVEPTCTEQGYILNTCTVCGFTYNTDYVDAKGHDCRWVQSVKPTYTSAGLKIYQCRVCDYIVSRQTVPMLERPTASSTTKANNGTTVIHYTPTAPHTIPTTVLPTIPGDLKYDGFRVVPGEGCLKIVWLKDTRVTGYNIYMSADGKAFKKVASVKNKDSKGYYIVKNLEYSKVYYVRITAFVGDNIEGKESRSFTVKTK